MSSLKGMYIWVLGYVADLCDYGDRKAKYPRVEVKK